MEKVIPVVEEWKQLPKLATQLLPTTYHPKLDQTPLLGEVDAQLYMLYIGILQWAVELGCIDVALHISMMA